MIFLSFPLFFFFFHAAEFVNLRGLLWSYNQRKLLLSNGPLFLFNLSLLYKRRNKLEVLWRWHGIKSIEILCIRLQMKCTWSYERWILSSNLQQTGCMFSWKTRSGSSVPISCCVCQASSSRSGRGPMSPPVLHGWVGICTHCRVPVARRESSAPLTCKYLVCPFLDTQGLTAAGRIHACSLPEIQGITGWGVELSGRRCSFQSYPYRIG